MPKLKKNRIHISNQKTTQSSKSKSQKSIISSNHFSVHEKEKVMNYKSEKYVKYSYAEKKIKEILNDWIEKKMYYLKVIQGMGKKMENERNELVKKFYGRYEEMKKREKEKWDEEKKEMKNEMEMMKREMNEKNDILENDDDDDGRKRKEMEMINKKEIRRMKDELKKKNEKIMVQKKKIEMNQKENENKKEKENENENEIKEMKEELGMKDKKIKILNTKIETLSMINNNNNTESNNGELKENMIQSMNEKEIKQLKDELILKNKKIQKLNNKIYQLNVKTESFELLQKEKRFDNRSVDVEEKENIVRLHKELDEKEKRIIELESTVYHKNVDNNVTKGNKEKMNDDNKDKIINELKKRIIELESTHKNGDNVTKGNQEKTNDSDKIIIELKKKLKKNEKEIKRLRATTKTTTTKNVGNEEDEQQQKKIEELEKKIIELESSKRIETNNDDNAENIEVEKSNQQIIELKKELELKEKQILEIKNGFNKEMDSKSSSDNESNDKIKEMERLISEKEKEIGELKNDYDSKKQIETQKFNDQLSEKDEEINNLKTKVSKSEVEIEKLKELKEKQEKTIQSFNDSHKNVSEKLKNDIKDYEDKIKEMENICTDKDSKIDNLENDKKGLEKKIEEMKKKGSDEVSGLKGKFKKKIKDLENVINDKDGEIARMKKMMEKLNEENLEVENKIKKLMQGNESGVEKIRKLENDLKESESSRKLMEENTKKFQEQNKQIKISFTKLEKYKNDLKERTTFYRFKMGFYQTKVNKLQDEFEKSENVRRKLHNIVEDSKGKIRVYLRCRPMSRTEKERNCENVIHFINNSNITIFDSKHKKTKKYAFNSAFRPSSTQIEVYSDTKDLVQSSVDGYNVCIFAYGQTGSGKTYTISGEEGNDGIVPRSIKDIFKLKEKRKKMFKFKVESYLVELYLDKFYDLYSKDQKKTLGIKKNSLEQVVVTNVVKKRAETAEELLKQYKLGLTSRHVRSTAMNEASSRSHSVLTILVTSVNKTNQEVLYGKLSLVDLAGSERQKKTGADAIGMKEAMAINTSLSALGNVINALSSRKKFVPYRDDKLTMLLSDSIGGKAKTLMFVCVSPADYNTDETINALTYATRTKSIVNKVEKAHDTKENRKLRIDVEFLTKHLEEKFSREEMDEILEKMKIKDGTAHHHHDKKDDKIMKQSKLLGSNLKSDSSSKRSKTPTPQRNKLNIPNPKERSKTPGRTRVKK